MEISEIDICNRALTEYLGVKPIMGFDEKTDAARVCKQNYAAARRDALAGSLWAFASMWHAGVALALDPKSPWLYCFTYPTDALRVFEIQRASEADPLIPFEVTDRPDGVDGKMIHCNLSAPVFVYTRDKENPAQYDVEFVAALAALLAEKIAIPLTKNLKIKQTAMQAYVNLRGIALARSLNEGPRDTDALGFHHQARG